MPYHDLKLKDFFFEASVKPILLLNAVTMTLMVIYTPKVHFLVAIISAH